MIKNKPSAGFTLLEMSIVLILIAIVVGAIMTGRSLLVSSKLQAIMTDANSYATAVSNFEQAYQALPGDYTNAVSQWGAAGGSTSDNYTISCGGTQGTVTATCNGNGDGEIGSVSNYQYEMFLFWQHLYNAGMFTQTMSGVADSGGNLASTPGWNVPLGSFRGSGWSVIWWGTEAGDSDHFAGSYGDVLIFGAQVVGGNNVTYNPILTADQASAVDAKMDDGMPATGKIRSFANGASPTINPNCATTGVASTAVYNVSGATGSVNPNSPLCALVFVMGF